MTHPYRDPVSIPTLDYCTGAEMRLSWWQRVRRFSRLAWRRATGYTHVDGQPRAIKRLEPLVLLTCPICGDEAPLDLDTKRLERHPRRYACANANCQGPTIARLNYELARMAGENACAFCGAPSTALHYRRPGFAGLCDFCADCYQYSEECGGDQTIEAWINSQAGQPGHAYAYGGPGKDWVRVGGHWYCCRACAIESAPPCSDVHKLEQRHA